MYDTIVAASLTVALLFEEDFAQDMDNRLRSLTCIGADDLLDISA